MTEKTAETRRVLIVVPAGPTARGMEDALKSEGLAVSSAANAYSAIARFTAAPADAVVLSLASLDERDLEIIRVFREARPEVFVLLCFSAERRELAVRGLSLGADAYVLEPFYLGEFVDLVKRGVDRARASAPAPAAPAPPPAGKPPPVASNELERLAGAVAHAANNPLQIMELLLSEGGATDAAEFRQEIARVHEVVEELLWFSRRDDFHPTGIDLNALVAEAVGEGLGPGGRVEWRPAPELPPFSGDERQLRQAFATLAKAAATRGTPVPVVLETSGDGGLTERHIVVRLAFPELLLSRQEREGFSKPFQGPVAGAVGLAGVTARTAIEMHGGTVEIDSRSGEGTTIVVHLPAEKAPVPRSGSRHT